MRVRLRSPILFLLLKRTERKIKLLVANEGDFSVVFSVHDQWPDDNGKICVGSIKSSSTLNPIIIVVSLLHSDE